MPNKQYKSHTVELTVGELRSVLQDDAVVPVKRSFAETIQRLKQGKGKPAKQREARDNDDQDPEFELE